MILFSSSGCVGGGKGGQMNEEFSTHTSEMKRFIR